MAGETMGLDSGLVRKFDLSPIFADDSGAKQSSQKTITEDPADIEVEVHSRPPNLSSDSGQLAETVVRRIRYNSPSKLPPFNPVHNDQKIALIAYSAYRLGGVGAQIRK